MGGSPQWALENKDSTDVAEAQENVSGKSNFLACSFALAGTADLAPIIH